MRATGEVEVSRQAAAMLATPAARRWSARRGQHRAAVRHGTGNASMQRIVQSEFAELNLNGGWDLATLASEHVHPIENPVRRPAAGAACGDVFLRFCRPKRSEVSRRKATIAVSPSEA